MSRTVQNSETKPASHNMARVYGDEETTQWLNNNGLSTIADKCKSSGITMDALIVADIQDFKELCKEAGISKVMELKLKNAVMKISDSVIARQAYQPKKQIIIISDAEKKLKDQFDEILVKIQLILNENTQNETDLEENKQAVIATVNSNMDQVVELIEFRRKNMIDELNGTIMEKMSQLKQRKSRANELYQQYMIVKNQLDQNHDGKLSIQQVLSSIIMEYQQFNEEYGDIQCNLSPVIDINNMDQAIKENCHLSACTELDLNQVKPFDIIDNIKDDINNASKVFDDFEKEQILNGHGMDNDDEEDAHYDDNKENKPQQQQEKEKEKVINDSKEEEENEAAQIQITACRFSNVYRGRHGLITLKDDNTVMKKAYRKQPNIYTFIALDIDPITTGTHCFRIKVRGRNGFMYFGIHRDIKYASDSYEDTQACGAEVFSWHKSDTEKKATYDKTFQHCRDKRKLCWDMMVTLNDNERSLKITQNFDGNKSKQMVIPILTENAGWTPYFILFAGGHHPDKYMDTTLRVYKIDPKVFGRDQHNYKE